MSNLSSVVNELHAHCNVRWVSREYVWKCCGRTYGLELHQIRGVTGVGVSKGQLVVNQQVHVQAGNGQARWNCQRASQCSINKFTYFLEMGKRDGIVRTLQMHRYQMPLFTRFTGTTWILRKSAMVMSSKGGENSRIGASFQTKRRLQCRLKCRCHDIKGKIANYDWSCQWMGNKIMIAYHCSHPSSRMTPICVL